MGWALPPPPPPLPELPLPPPPTPSTHPPPQEPEHGNSLPVKVTAHSRSAVVSNIVVKLVSENGSAGERSPRPPLLNNNNQLRFYSITSNPSAGEWSPHPCSTNLP